MNKNPALRFATLAATCAVFFLIFYLAKPTTAAARPDALEDCVEKLAKKAAALPHERRMSLVWSNHAGLPEQRAEALRASFAAQMEAAQIRLVQGEAVPALRVSIEQTASHIVFTALVPAESGANPAIEEVERGLALTGESTGKAVRLEKQLVWRQESRILSAALLAVAESTDKRLAVLTEEALTVYRGGPDNWRQENTKAVPPPHQLRRSAEGQILASEDRPNQIGLMLPGRRCEASLEDASAISCAATTAVWPTGRLMALPGCTSQTWWLKSDANDFAWEDRLSLRVASGAKGSPVLAELNLLGPAMSISAGESAGEATVVVRNLASGNYEVYRVAVVCD